MLEGKRRNRENDSRSYAQRVDFHRIIHRELDDGALLALCEAYGEEKPARSL